MVRVLLLFASFGACTPDPAGPGDDDDDTVEPTGSTGETGSTPTGADCTDGIWIPGAFWDLDTSVSTDPRKAVVDLAIASDDGGVAPVVLSTRLDQDGAPLGLEIAWRSSTEPAGTLGRVVTVEAALSGAAFGLAADGSFDVGGHQIDVDKVVPVVASVGRDGASAVTVLDAAVDGAVTAGPVRTDDGTWWLGRSGVAPDNDVVLWRVDGGGTVHEAFRAPGVPGALIGVGDGRVLFGAGDPERATVHLGDAGGIASVLDLPRSATGDVPGAITAAAVQGDRLVYAWSALAGDGAALDGSSWRVYDGTLDDPAGATLVDQDGPTEAASARSLAIHPSGALFAGGSWVREAGAPAAPYVRLGQDGAFSTTFAAFGKTPGWIDAVTIDPTGEVWVLCVFESGDVAVEVQLLRLECQL